MENDNELIQFEAKGIRKVWHEEQWFFAIIDIIAILAETSSPRQYWTKVKNGLVNESQVQPFWLQLKMIAPDGKNRLTDCANTEGIFRIIMSVPSPKAEPLRLWLAQVGTERIQETENPELAFARAKEIYSAKGYSDEWIENRWKTITTRNALTKEWQNRGIKEDKEYSILTATIAKHTFGLTPSEHGKFKGLEKQNLRDHMTPLELIFSALSEEVTRQITINDDAQGFYQSQEAAVQGGNYTKKAMVLLEKEKNIKVLSSDNFLGLKDSSKSNEIPEDDKPN
jgi:prophage antirepressor-like protein